MAIELLPGATPHPPLQFDARAAEGLPTADGPVAPAAYSAYPTIDLSASPPATRE